MNSTTTRKPSKPWHVYGIPGSVYISFNDEKMAYGYVRDLAEIGRGAQVWHWQDRFWRLYERIEPVPASTEGAER